MAKWGAAKWGSAKWGGDPKETYHQGYNDGSKQDTYYYGSSDGGQTSASSFSDFNTDLGQLGLSFSTTGGHPQLSSAFANIGDGSTIEAVVEVTDTDTGYFFWKAGSGTTEYGIRIRTGGIIRPTINNADDTNGDLTLPGVTTTAKRYAIAWATELNKDTTGGSDILRSWIYAFNIDDGTYDQVTWTHALKNADIGAQTVSLWGQGGSNIFTGTARVLRFSRRFHTATEVHEDWVLRSETPTTTGKTRQQPFTPNKASGIGDDGALVGPVESAVANVAKRSDMRTVSPVLNLFFNTRTILDNTYAPTNWSRLAPGSSTVYIPGQYLWWRPIPPVINKLRARVNLTHSDSASGSLVARIIYMNKLPTINKIAAEPKPIQFQQFYDDVTIATTTSSATGWTAFDILPIPEDAKGGCYIALGLTIPNGTMQVAVNAIHVDGLFDQSTGGLITDIAMQP